MIDPYCQVVVWSQFGAAIEMLENAIRACPEELWKMNQEPIQQREESLNPRR